MRAVLSVLLGLSCILAASAGAQARLTERMSPEDFKRSGLGKLTAAELAHLEAWLEAESTGQAPPASPVPPVAEAAEVEAEVERRVAQEVERRFRAEVDREVRRQAAEAGVEVFDTPTPASIRARIVGTFRGWRGRTLFPLDNGMIWQQVDSGVFSDERESPRVTIRKTLLGSYVLRLEGAPTDLGVRRIK